MCGRERSLPVARALALVPLVLVAEGAQDARVVALGVGDHPQQLVALLTPVRPVLNKHKNLHGEIHRQHFNMHFAVDCSNKECKKLA